jgi:hypothetical protein
VPENNIDIKVILMALREEIIEHGIRVSNREFPKGTNVVVPSVTGPFDIWFEAGNVYLKRFYEKKKYRIPCEFEDEILSEKIIDVLCAYINYFKLNQFIP